MRGNKNFKPLILVVLFAVIVALLDSYLRHHHVAVLDAKGLIAEKERNLFYFGLGLSAIVVIPVYIMTVAIIWKYRETNKHSKKYSPDWDGSKLLEGLWWGIPCLIIFVLSIVTWNSSHALDPYKSLGSNGLDVEVVALDWKWLFIYPEQNIASVNMLEVPVNTPVNFEITSDTVMNSFWIPNLGGQIYAMPGMNTELHLMADKAGTFRGSSANISGRDFADMSFTAKAGSVSEFKDWVNQAKQSGSELSVNNYNLLSKPGAGSVNYYSSLSPGLYNHTVLKYMTQQGGTQ